MDIITSEAIRGAMDTIRFAMAADDKVSVKQYEEVNELLCDVYRALTRDAKKKRKKK